jgi:nitronate monooxygenase
MWPTSKLIDLLDIELPIIQAPMAGANDSTMAIAVSKAGGLGSLPCAMLDTAKIRSELDTFRQQTDKPINVNFFCHTPAVPDEDRQAAWKQQLAGYYQDMGLDESASAPAPNRAPFDEAMCEMVEQLKPEVVSFHFGLPENSLLERVKSAGSLVLASATTVAEACWLEDRDCDVIIAQGYEAGGHRGMFLSDDIYTQAGTFALVPQIVDAVKVPVIATGGICDGRGVAAAFVLGAAAAQIGTAYLFTPEAIISDLHRAALETASDDGTALTNLFSGRPARGFINKIMREIGPMSDLAPAFPTAGGALAPLKAAAEARGTSDYSSLWSGQAASLCQTIGSGDLTRQLAQDALKSIQELAASD